MSRIVIVLPLVALLGQGCAKVIWNKRNIDCSKGVDELFVEAVALDISHQNPHIDSGDDCLIHLEGLRFSSSARDGNKLEFYDVDQVFYSRRSSVPSFPVELVWSESADITFADEEGLRVSFETGSLTESWGWMNFDGADDEVRLHLSESDFDEAEIETRGDVTITMPAGGYAFDLDGGTIELGEEFSEDEDGPEVEVTTDGTIVVRTK